MEATYIVTIARRRALGLQRFHVIIRDTLIQEIYGLIGYCYELKSDLRQEDDNEQKENKNFLDTSS